MFTGIIEERGILRRVERHHSGGRLLIDAPRMAPELSLGESVAVSGVCLTVSSLTPEGFAVDLSEETLSRTHFSRTQGGAPVNLERALRVTDRLGGHFVTGHVDGIGEVREISPQDVSSLFRISCPSPLVPLLVPQGSVAVEGISLTVVSVEGDSFTVALIPYTLKVTTLSESRVGDPVNLEMDLIGKYVLRALQAREGADLTALKGCGSARES